METLPNELLEMIFADFKKDDLLSCRQACRTWNRIMLDLFAHRFVVYIPRRRRYRSRRTGRFAALHAQSLDFIQKENCLVSTFRKLVQDKIAPTFSEFGKKLCVKVVWNAPDEYAIGDPKRQRLEELEEGKVAELAMALSDVHSLVFCGSHNCWLIRLFLNNTPRLESLSLSGIYDSSNGGRGLEGLKKDTLQQLRSLDISTCINLNDKTLLSLTALMPPLEYFNAATKMRFYKSFSPRCYAKVEKDPKNPALWPNFKKLSFDAFRVALKLHITSLRTLCLFAGYITPDHIDHLLDCDSLKDIYIKGKIDCNSPLGKSIAQLNEKAKAANKNIYYQLGNTN